MDKQKPLPKEREVPPYSKSVYKASDVESSDLVETGSVYAGSDLVESIAVLSVEPCETCKRKEQAESTPAAWYCTHCEERLCEECKRLHKIFKPTANHTISSLNPSCDLCAEKKTEKRAKFYCQGCEEFLCNECKSSHQQFKKLRDHIIVNSADKIKQKPTKATRTQKAADNSAYVSSSERSESPFAKRRAIFSNTFDVRTMEDSQNNVVTTSTFLSHNTLLLTDVLNNKLKVFDENFQLKQTKTFDNYARRIACFDENEIAVLTKGSIVHRLSMQGGTLKEKGAIAISFDCFGIDYISKNRLAVSGLKTTGIFCVLNMVGSELSRKCTTKTGSCLFKKPVYVSVDRRRGRAYVSDYDKDILVALDLTSNNDIIFIYRHTDLSAPGGISLDVDGNIYVCGDASNNIHQVNPEGRHLRIVVSKADMPIHPCALAFNPSFEILIVSGGDIENNSGHKAFVFNMK